MSVLFIDLDRFKAVNDTLGHDVGDELLEGVAERLRQCVREADTVARLGGDEFVIVLSDIIQPQNAGQIAQKIIDSLSGVYLLRGYELHVTPSIGISIYPEDGEDAQSLMKNADTAMYTAKQVGASFRYYAAEMNASAFQRMTVENSLRHALVRNELSLHYQPLVNLESGKVTGVEALLRWHHPELGMVTPDMFIPIAEESSLIIPIGEWVLGEACRQIKHWREAGYPDLRVAVNISSRQLWQPNLVDTILRIVAESGADAAGLELELTESMLMRHTEETVAMLTKLRDHGIRLAVDDFGTGYSSLAYLKSFPIHTLKIDRSFIRDISEDPNDAAITSAIIAMAHSLSLGVIAEGVETAAQLAYIRGQGCDEAQGFYFSKPLPADQFWDVLQKS
jgi:diguanylate cyclase (GGDEF)-like protein